MPDAIPDDADAVLVAAPRPPCPTVDRVALSPRPCATCDGDRWHLPLVVRVVAGGEDRRRRFGRHRLVSAVDLVAEVLRTRDVREVWFYRTRHLRDYWATGTVARLEERLVGVVRGTDGRLVTWTGGTDERAHLYDHVVE